MLKPIIFWGATGQAKVLAEFIGQCGYELVALFDNNPSTRAPIQSVPLFIGLQGFEKWRRTHLGEMAGLVAIGGAGGRARVEIQDYLWKHGVVAVVAVHPTAFVAGNAKLGRGTQILARASVCAEAVLGEGCIVNTAASVDHECRLKDGVHIGPGATLCGCVEVGAYSFIGAGAVVLPRIKIGANSVIGAGAVVTRDLPEDSVAYGNPARIVRKNEVAK